MTTPKSVAFHAVASSTNHLQSGQTLVFANVRHNIGNGYHASGGIFIAPTAGVYIFSVSVSKYGVSGDVHLSLMKNGVYIVGAYASTQDQSNQGSATVPVQMEIGDEVWVSVKRPDDSTVYGDSLTSFSGTLITLT